MEPARVWEFDGTDQGTGWKDLLRRYIRHVVECEGTDFLEGWRPDAWHESSVKFTDEEWAELAKLAGYGAQR